MIQQSFCSFMCVHYLQEEQTVWSNSHTAFGCTYTLFTENNCGALHLAFCALSVGKKVQSSSHNTCCCLCIAFTEKNSQETAIILHLAVCALSSLRKTVKELRLFSIWLSVHRLHWEKQSGNCGYSPLGPLCTVLPEKNCQEAEFTLHLTVCGLHWEKQTRNTGQSAFSMCTVLTKNILHEIVFTLYFALCVVSLIKGDILVGSSSSFWYHA